MTIAEKIGWVFIGALIAIAVAFIFMIPTWLLWNWLCPKLFGLPEISLLESLGLLLLTGFLFRSSSSSSKD